VDDAIWVMSLWPPRTVTLRPPLHGHEATDRDAYKFVAQDDSERRVERRARNERRGDD